MRKQFYFEFNGINSMDVKGIILDTIPTPNAPARRVKTEQIAGRSGDLRIVENGDYNEDVFEVIEKNVKMAYMKTDYDFVKRWLRGTSKLFLSNQPDRYFRASIDNLIPLEKIIREIHTFTVSFSCFPYAFLTIGDTPIVYNPTGTTWATIIVNDYDLALPHLKIYGTGDIGLKINGVETDFYAVDEYVECDTELQQCYKGTKNMGMNMSGFFPALPPGKNTIEFTGNIKQVILTPKWRTL